MMPLLMFGNVGAGKAYETNGKLKRKRFILNSGHDVDGNCEAFASSLVAHKHVQRSEDTQRSDRSNRLFASRDLANYIKKNSG